MTGLQTITAVLALWAGVTTTASAAISFVGSAGDRSAKAIFTDLGSGNLQVELLNTYGGDTVDQSHVLTALFFSGLNGLTPVSALLPTGAKVWTDHVSVVSSGLNVGGEWAYGSALSGTPGGGTAGISSAGFGLFGQGNFNGPNIDPPPNGALNGSGYGIVSAGYAGLALDGLSGNSYAQNSVVFRLSGFTGSLANIANVTFQYGTTLSTAPSGAEPSLPGTLETSFVPEPRYGLVSALVLLPLAGLPLVRRRRQA